LLGSQGDCYEFSRKSLLPLALAIFAAPPAILQKRDMEAAAADKLQRLAETLLELGAAGPTDACVSRFEDHVEFAVRGRFEVDNAL